MSKGNAVRIFTDGACSGNPGIGGWAAIICTDTEVKTLSGGCDDTTNNRMELLAVVNGLTHVLVKGHREVLIASDSAYVVNAINNRWVNKWQANGWIKTDGEPVKNTDLWQSLLELIESFDKVEFMKVKGHAGHHLNETADKCARNEVQRLKKLKETAV